MTNSTSRSSPTAISSSTMLRQASLTARKDSVSPPRRNRASASIDHVLAPCCRFRPVPFVELVRGVTTGRHPVVASVPKEVTRDVHDRGRERYLHRPRPPTQRALRRRLLQDPDANGQRTLRLGETAVSGLSEHSPELRMTLSPGVSRGGL